MSMQVRIAVVACVLSAGLVIGSGGGAIAVADTDAGASTSGAQPEDGPSGTAGPAHGPIATIADSLRKAVQNSLQSTVQGVTGTLTLLAKPGQLPDYIHASPKTTFGGTPTVYGSAGGPTSADVSSLPSEAPLPLEAPPAPLASPASEVTVASPFTTSPHTTSPPTTSPLTTSPTTSPMTSPMTSAPAYVPPNPIAAFSNALAPVTNAFTAVADTIASGPGVVAALPTSMTPVSDVLTYFQNVFTSVGYAGRSLTQLPTGLVGLLGVSATAPTSTIGAGSGAPRLHAVTAAPIMAPGWSALPQPLSIPGVEGGPAASTLPVPVTPLDVTTTGVVRGESGTTSAPTAPTNDGTNDVLSTVEHVIGAFVATVSLAALAAVALPGLAGLLSTCAAGMRVGYRQAKAGSGLPNTVMSRFVGSGPMGVVRSGARVELRVRAPRIIPTGAGDDEPTRTLRLVRSESASSAHLLDQAV